MYAPFWTQHQIFHLILSAAMRNPEITYDEFLKSLMDVSENQDSSTLAMDIIGRHVNETDFLEDDVVSLCFLSLSSCMTLWFRTHTSYPQWKISNADLMCR
jgi:hypothetical protein